MFPNEQLVKLFWVNKRESWASFLPRLFSSIFFVLTTGLGLKTFCEPFSAWLRPRKRLEHKEEGSWSREREKARERRQYYKRKAGNFHTFKHHKNKPWNIVVLVEGSSVKRHEREAQQCHVLHIILLVPHSILPLSRDTQLKRNTSCHRGTKERRERKTKSFYFCCCRSVLSLWYNSRVLFPTIFSVAVSVRLWYGKQSEAFSMKTVTK